jgi:outer membrane immunogenic protein
MKKGLALLAAVSALGFAAPAYAQDDVNPAFTGPWVAGLVGYDNTRAGSDVDDDTTDDDFDDGINGVNYGIGAGFDFAMGGVVLGVEGEWMESEASSQYDRSDDTGLGIDSLSTGRDLYVGGRVGFLVGKNAMIYGKGGYTNAKYNILASDDLTDTRANFKLDGWRAGAGVEVAVTNNLFVKAEYRYSNYTDGEVEAPNGVESDNFGVDVDRHQGVVGVGVRF